MADVQQKHTNFIQRSVLIAQQFKDAYDAWVALRAEWDALDYTDAITDADCTGALAHLTAAQVQAFYTSQGNLVTYWTTGNATNICALIP